MTLVTRVLPARPVASIDDYRDAGGGAALAAARRVEPEAVIAEIEAAGLRGRGGAGFPTGAKWRTVAANRSPEPDLPTTVVVNAAEGEPGTYKDRAILRADPYARARGRPDRGPRGRRRGCRGGAQGRRGRRARAGDARRSPRWTPPACSAARR